MDKSIALVSLKRKSRSKNHKVGSENQESLPTCKISLPQKWNLSPTQKQKIQTASEAPVVPSVNVLITPLSGSKASQSWLISIKRIPKRPIQVNRCRISYYFKEAKCNKRRQTHQQIQPPKKQPKQR